MSLITQIRQKLFVKSAINSSAKLLEYIAGHSASGRISNRAAVKQSAVFQCTRVLAESIGALPMALYQQDSNGNRVKAKNHPVHKLLSERPNSFQTPVEFNEMLMVHLCFRGNFTAKKVVLGNGEVKELIPFHPDACTRKLNDDYQVEHTVLLDNGEIATYSDDEIFHVKIFSFDGINGLNPIEYARKSISLDRDLEGHGAVLFKNGARPGGVLSTDARIEQDMATKYREMWEEANGGDRQGGTAVLGNGLTYQPIGLNGTDAQWLESRNFQKSDIAAFYRVPPHKINQLERSTNNNIEHQSLEFVRDSLAPYAVKIEQRIKRSLLTDDERQKGFYAKLNFNSILRGDMTSRAEFYTSLANIAALSPNEVRALEEMNPYDGGDEYLRPLNMASTGENE